MIILALVMAIVLSLTPAMLLGLIRQRYYTPYLFILLFYTAQVPFLIGSYSFFNNEEIYTGSAYVILSNCLLSLFIYLGDQRLPPMKGSWQQNSRSIEFSYLFFAVAFVYFALQYYNGGLNIGRGNVWAARAQQSAGFVDPVLTYLGFVLFVLWTMLRSKILMVLTFPILAYIFLVTGARVIFIILFGALWYYMLKRTNLKTLAILAPIVAAVGVTMHVLLRAIRGISVSDLSTRRISQVFSETFSSATDFTGGDGSIAEGFLLALRVHDLPNTIIMPLTTVIRTLTFPFPSFIFSFKPPDMTYLLWRYAVDIGYFNDDEYYSSLIESYAFGQNGSLHPIIWGDALLNAGWLGAFIWPALLALLLLKIESVITKGYGKNFPAILAAMAAPSLLYIIRGNVYLGILLLLPLAGFWLFCRFIDRRNALKGRN